MAVSFCFKGLSAVYNKLFFEYFSCLLKLMALLLGFISALTEIFAVLLKDFYPFLQNLVMLGGCGASSIELMYLIVMEFDLAGEVLTAAFKSTDFILQLVVFQLNL